MANIHINELLKNKTRVLILISGGAVIFLLLFVAIKKQNNEDGKIVDETSQVLLEPEVGEGKKVTDKVDAYKRLEQEELRKKRELEESQVRGSDFYFDMQDDEYEKKMEARIKKMQSDPYSNVMSEYGNDKEESPKEGQSHTVDNSFAERMRKQLDGIEDQETMAEIVSQAKKNERLRKEMEKSNKFQQQLYEEYLAKSKEQIESSKKVNSSSAPSRPKTAVKKQAMTEPVPVELDEKAKRRAAMQAWNKADGIDTQGKTFQAVIHKTQTVTSGRMAMFRTREEIDAGTIIIPANTILYGTVSIAQNRLNVNIASVTVNRNVYPVKFSLYGTDGGLGIPVKIDKVQKAGEDRINDEIVNTVRGATGVIGNVIGSIANAVKSEKDMSCTLIDNQTVYLKLKKY